MPSLRWFQRHGVSEYERVARVIVGLGNPGSRYAASRHNVGFHVLDRLAQKHRLLFSRRRFNARLAEGEIKTGVLLVKPQTYMNLSGQAVGKVLASYRVPLSDIIVVYDDLDLPLGRIRLRPSGSAGGHHGMESIIAKIHSEDFPRLRVGIGRPESREDVNHVLGRFTEDELRLLDATYDRAVEAIEMWIGEGIEKAMNVYNRDG